MMDSDTELVGLAKPRPIRLPSAIIVCETTPYWVPELQRQFHQTDVAVRGCRKWSEFRPLSAEYSRLVHVVDFAGRPADCLTAMAQRATSNAIPLVMIAAPKWAPLEFLLREAGVNAFYDDLPTGPELARCCRRWLT